LKVKLNKNYWQIIGIRIIKRYIKTYFFGTYKFAIFLYKKCKKIFYFWVWYIHYNKIMIFAYIRVSTDKQNVENQRFEILKYADSKKIRIDAWVEETVSGTKNFKDRKLGEVLDKMQAKDMLLVSELSRLGRNLMEVMSILHLCMDKQIRVITIKEGYELGDNINAKVLAFAFSLSAEIERKLISQRTKEALARKKQEGKKLGRPKGSLNKQVKLSGREEDIQMLLQKKVAVSAIARILGVSRLTLAQFIKSRKLKQKMP